LSGCVHPHVKSIIIDQVFIEFGKRKFY